MKRSPKKTSGGARPSKIEDALNEAQFAGVGLFIMAYTELEVAVRSLLAEQLGLRGSFAQELLTRINGFEGIVALIRAHLIEEISDIAGVPLSDGSTKIVDSPKPEIVTMLGDTLAAVLELKGFRDAIAHAVVFDSSNAIAGGGGGRKKTYEIMLSETGLSALHTRLEVVRLELSSLRNAIIWSYSARPLFVPNPAGTPFQVQFEPEIQAEMAQVLQHQSHRRSLPPLPAFPA